MHAHLLRVRTTPVVRALIATGLSLLVPAQALAEPVAADAAFEEASSDPGLEDNVAPSAEQQLAQLGIPATIPSLNAVLQDVDADPELRALSVVALGDTQDPTVVPLLLAALDDVDETVRRTAIAALHSLPDPRSVPRLTAILDDESTRGTDAGIDWRTSVLGAVSTIDTEEAAAVVLRTAFDPREAVTVRCHALMRLRAIGVAAPVADLRALLLDREADIRIAAAWALIQTRDPGSVPVFVSAVLEDENRSELRMHALVGLEVLTGETFRRLDRPEGLREEDWPEIAGRVEAWWQSNRRDYE